MVLIVSFTFPSFPPLRSRRDLRAKGWEVGVGRSCRKVKGALGR